MPGSIAVFSKYPSPVFVETGSYLGDGIQQALDAGFEKVISIELSDKYFGICQKRFAGNDRVTLIKGDSALILSDVIAPIQTQITFWLDGHWSAGDTAKGVYTTPLMEELKAIAQHPIKTHVLLIDDMRCWKAYDPVHGFEESDVLRQLERMGISDTEFLDSPYAPKDILVARMHS